MYTFRKSERLCNKKLTKELFLKGDSYNEEFLRIVYNKSFFRTDFLKIQIIVPKRRRKGEESLTEEGLLKQ